MKPDSALASQATKEEISSPVPYLGKAITCCSNILAKPGFYGSVPRKRPAIFPAPRFTAGTASTTKKLSYIKK